VAVKVTSWPTFEAFAEDASVTVVAFAGSA
jgi:hypothetical protein